MTALAGGLINDCKRSPEGEPEWEEHSDQGRDIKHTSEPSI